MQLRLRSLTLAARGRHRLDVVALAVSRSDGRLATARSVENSNLPRLRHPGRTQTSHRGLMRENAPDQTRSGAKSPASMRKQGLFASGPLARCPQRERARVRVCEVVGASSTEQSQPASPSRPAIEPESAEPHAPANRRRNLDPGRARLGASAAEVAGDQVVPGFGACETRRGDGRGVLAGVVTSDASAIPVGRRFPTGAARGN
jgi:hypothetical protein